MCILARMPPGGRGTSGGGAGARAHAGTGHRDPFFCRPLKARGSYVP